eukprot:TRINITY_DN3656_c0_g1_i4.p1 TRINITY_DN3656_c0_g1~~TRINITY_DN3656_c0_g1_i4.p1  ORF type:complete len:260 (+),score=52.74 TRINITY_DN3656_c0_g1_i4:38-781(+)
MAAEVWWKRIKEVTAIAIRNEWLKPIQTHFIRLEDGGVNWIIRVVASLAEKPIATSDSSPNTKNKGEEGSKSSNDKKNPFLPPDPDLFLAEINGGSHNFMLNKFNVSPYHTIIATKEFRPQEEGLDKSDFAASWFIASTINGLVFYNCGKEAGASQPHKHVQILPLPYEEEETDPNIQFPLERLLLKNSEESKEGDIFFLKELPFKHACLKLSVPDSKSDEYLEAQFLLIADRLGQKVDVCGAPAGR